MTSPTDKHRHFANVARSAANRALDYEHEARRMAREVADLRRWMVRLLIVIILVAVLVGITVGIASAQVTRALVDPDPEPYATHHVAGLTETRRAPSPGPLEHRDLPPPTTSTTVPAAPEPTRLFSAALAPVPAGPPQGNVQAIVWDAAVEFGIDPARFLAVCRCETGGTFDPGIVNHGGCGGHGCYGLLQHHGHYGPARFSALGYSWEQWSDPVANARVGANLVADGGWGHYACARWN